jgi:thiamine pyrophosphate-dependent acetolactate synthase large subunit-like protein
VEILGLKEIMQLIKNARNPSLLRAGEPTTAPDDLKQFAETLQIPARTNSARPGT